METKCERCGGEFRAWDERVFVTIFVGDVKASVCHACHNEIVGLIRLHPRWPERVEIGSLDTRPEWSAEEAQAKVTARTRLADESNGVFREFVLTLLPHQKRAADVADKVEA